ncbi:MAG: DUF72 domain-containing protein [Candidatus Methanomethyliaceae archaeon]|nr:DUF72 domain-containing protein [Candidatus Methanomethyliaceae archaeon]MDW7971452.1 DUF72 domain-containing protein [Nitrososphaerota archaeon]
MKIRVGTCGWSVKGGRLKYYETFPCIELQETFYKLPKIKTLEKYRKESPSNFEFIVKAWQAITHPINSPTWRKAEFPSWGNLENFGLLKPTEENFKAWEEILKVCKILSTKILIIQTPPSFIPSKENIENMRSFLSSLRRDGIIIGWESRGEWDNNLVKEICEKLELIHVVDPFRKIPSISSNITYFRLHGIGGREVNYSYVYTDEDLIRLRDILKKIDSEIIYVMFNNVKMAEDAKRFIKILEENP